MGSASVNIKEIDLSTRVPSFPGVFGGIVIPAKKGFINQPFLTTNDKQLLDVFTPNGTVEVGMDLAFFSALSYLEKSDKLWSVRAAKDAYYAGSSVKTASASTENQPLPSDQMLEDPDAYLFDSNPDVPGVAEVTDFDFSGLSGSTLDVSGTATNILTNAALDATEYYVWFNVTDGANTQTDPLLPGKTGIQVDVLTTDDDAALASKAQAAVDAISDFSAAVNTTVLTVTNAATGDTTDAVDGAPSVGVTITVQTQGVTEINLIDELFLIYSANEGEWGNDVGYKIVTDPDVVKEPDAFIIEVYTTSNQAEPVETHVVSRIESKKDGFGDNIYIEDVLTSSAYIRAKDNLAVDDNILPKVNTSIVFLDGGDDGLVVTDADMINAAQALSNKDELLLTVLMDGGYATAAYQQELEKIANLQTGRGDCVAILSTPKSEEDSATYLTDLVDYRKTTLNLNSSYAALYTPHVKVLDIYNNREIFVSPDGFAGAAISASASNYEIWFPPAGFKRGIINALDLNRKFTKGEMDVLYNEGINPIRFIPGKGIVIWGQKTLSSRPSALDRLNVRLLLIVIEPAIAEFLEDFLFDINDEGSRLLAKSKIDSYMERIQARRGVFAFSTVSDSSNNTPADIDAGRMIVDLYVSPSKSIEDIPLRVIITSTGADFSSLSV